MLEFLSSLLVAVIVFATTDLDNLLVLTVFFADPAMRPRNVVIGQFLGIGSLVLLSAASAFLALAVPAEWIGLLGIVPIILAVRGFLRLFGPAAVDDPGRREQRLQAKTHSQVLAVTLVTMAHGADNVGIYIPLFARNPVMIPVYVAVFAVMLTLSLQVGHALVKNRVLGERLRRYGRYVIPCVLLGLGVNILWGARPLLHI